MLLGRILRIYVGFARVVLATSPDAVRPHMRFAQNALNPETPRISKALHLEVWFGTEPNLAHKE